MGLEGCVCGEGGEGEVGRDGGRGKGDNAVIVVALKLWLLCSKPCNVSTHSLVCCIP